MVTRRSTPKKTAAKKSAPVAKKARKPAQTAARRATKSANMFDTLIDRYAGNDWLSFANKQRNALARDIRTLSEEILQKIAASPIFAQREDLLREARATLDALLHRINASSLLAKAIDKAKSTPGEILSMLNIPSQQELKDLQSKLNRIEHKLGGSKPGRASAR